MKKHPDLTKEQILEGNSKVELFSAIMKEVWDTRDKILAEKVPQPFAYTRLGPVYVVASSTITNDFEQLQRNIENILKEA